MRIAIFVSYQPPHIGGIESAVANQARGLAAMGARVEVVTSACDSAPHTGTQDGYVIHRLPAWNYFERRLDAPFPIFTPQLLTRAYHVVKRADVVHIHDAFYLTSWVAALWCRLLGKPLVMTQHVDAIPHPNRLVAHAQKAVYASAARYIFSISKRVIVLNSRVRAFLLDRRVDDSKIVFIPNGIDIAAYSPVSKAKKKMLRRELGLPTDAMLALFIGRFVPKKGFATLMAMPEIPGTHLVFAGGAFTSTDRADRHFLGKVPHSETPKIYQACDILVLPSEGEGFPVTIQEAMASGLPVITSDDPAYGLYRLGAEEIAFTRATADDLREAVMSLAADEPRRQRMSEASLRYAQENFALRHNCIRLMSIYRELCGA